MTPEAPHFAQLGRWVLAAMAGLTFCAWIGPVQAQATVPEATQGTIAGQVRLVHGEVAVLDTAGITRTPAVGSTLKVGDVIVTGPQSELHAQLEDGAYLAARPQTRLRIDAFKLQGTLQDQSWLSLVRGGLRMVSGWLGKAHPAAVRLQTPVATIGIRGTDIEVLHADAEDAPEPDAIGTHLLVMEGIGILATDSDELEVPAGAAAFAKDASQPPGMHPDVPRFMRKRAGRFDQMVDEEAANIKATILSKLQEKSLAATGETLAERIARFRAENPESTMTDRQLLRKAVRRAAQSGDDGPGSNRGNRGGRGGRR